jgi:hypothetical protein
VPPAATAILNAPQYLTGKALGDAAAAHIGDRLRGRASVVLLTHDSLQFQAPRSSPCAIRGKRAGRRSWPTPRRAPSTRKAARPR